jgi:hypothetical protein
MAQDPAHINLKIQRFDAIANEMCWHDNNTWIGPSSGNVGTDIDIGADVDQKDMLLGTPFQGISMQYAAVHAWVNS